MPLCEGSVDLSDGCFHQPAEIGVQLTEGMMTDPEASVSALVFQPGLCVLLGWRDRSKCSVKPKSVRLSPGLY
jgi:hypothetical protein